MQRYHIIVNGYVQGVGFRYFTQKTALLYGICGWVRNRADGTVEIDAEGKETNMVEFLKAIERGNRFADVKSIQKEKLEDMMNYRSFDIT